jgi:hypothetical protein
LELRILEGSFAGCSRPLASQRIVACGSLNRLTRVRSIEEDRRRQEGVQGCTRNLICSDDSSGPIFPAEGGSAGWEPDYQNLFVSAAEPDVPAGRDINWKRGRRGRPVEVIGGHPGLRGWERQVSRIVNRASRECDGTIRRKTQMKPVSSREDQNVCNMPRVRSRAE